MKPSTKKIVKTIVPLALGIFLIWLSLSKFTSDDFKTIKLAFLNANYGYIGLSLCIAVLSHLSRAYRWSFMLKPLGYDTKFHNNVFAVFISYFVNMGIPRAGEVARATTLNQYEDVPFDKAFGTIVAERLADMVMYLLIIIIGFFAQYELIRSLIISKLPKNPLLLLLIAILIGGILLVFLKLIQKSKNPFFQKIRNFILGLWTGVQSIFTMQKKWAFVLHTIFIWLCYIAMLYTVTFAFPETSGIGFNAILICFIVGTFAFATTNSGIGVYPLAIQKTLLLYAIPETIGASFGWIMWSSQIIIMLVLGLLSFLLLPIFNKSR